MALNLHGCQARLVSCQQSVPSSSGMECANNPSTGQMLDSRTHQDAGRLHSTVKRNLAEHLTSNTTDEMKPTEPAVKCSRLSTVVPPPADSPFQHAASCSMDNTASLQYRYSTSSVGTTHTQCPSSYHPFSIDSAGVSFTGSQKASSLPYSRVIPDKASI